MGTFEGVLGRMTAQPAKPYSSPAQALFHARRFRALMADARNVVAQKNVYDGQTWRFPAFARGRQANAWGRA